MRKLLLIMIFAAFMSCKKDKETVHENAIADSTTSALDSIQIPTFEDPDQSGSFTVVPQNINAEKGRAVFTQEGKVLFYFNENSRKGNIRIGEKDYDLDQFDFSENNYRISGPGVKIEATNGDFKETTGDCVMGTFPEVQVTLNEESVNLPNINVQDCPNY